MKFCQNRSCPIGPVAKRNRPAGRRGAVTVEFAIVASLLFLLIFGGIELVRVSMMRHNVDHAAYVGARRAIIPGANANQARTAVRRYLATLGLTGAKITITPAVIQEDTPRVTVQVDLPVAGNSLVTPRFVFGDLSGRSELLTERNPIQMLTSLPGNENRDPGNPRGTNDDNSGEEEFQQSNGGPPPTL